MIPVPLLDDGPDMDVVENDWSRRMRRSKACGACPSTAILPARSTRAETIERLARMKTAAPDFRIFWDNAYAVHHLTPERIEIANIDEACARHGHAESRVHLRLHVQDHRSPAPASACSRARRTTSAW